MFDVVALGEALIDFSPAAPGPMGNPGFEMNPGGAPINCLAANVRLGGAGAFIGMVGDDFFGRFLKRSMENIGIDTTGLVYTNQTSTTIDFVSNTEDGEREFAFFRNPGADMLLQSQHLNEQILIEAKIFHFGSLSLTDNPARTATYTALEACKDAGVSISFDPNYRDSLWNDRQQAVLQMIRGAAYADILKVSLEEMTLMTGVQPDRIEAGAEKLFGQGKRAVFVTAGAEGAYYLTEAERGFVPGYAVDAVDTTGCGDAFLGAIHYLLCHRPTLPMDEMVRFANAVAALCATGRTGFASMPNQQAVARLMAQSG